MRSRSTDDRAVVRGGYGIFLNQWAYSVQTAFARNLPFFFTRQVDVPTVAARACVPDQQHPDRRSRQASSAPNIMDHAYAVEYTQTWSGGLQYELLPSTMVEVSYMGSWTLGADNATIRNVPEPGPGSVQSRRDDSAGGSDSNDPVRRQVDLPRPDAQGRAAPASQLLLLGQLHAVGSPLTMRRARERRNRKPMSHKTFATSSTRPASGPHRASTIVISSWQAARISSRSSQVQAGSRKDVLGDWRVNAVFFAQSGAPFTVNLGVDQANVGSGPAQRPDQSQDPNLSSDQRRPERWFDTSAFSLPALYTFGSAPRNSVIGPGLCEPGSCRREDVDRGWDASARTAVGSVQRAEQGELRHPESNLRHGELRPHLQREESARDAAGREVQFLRTGDKSQRQS